MSFKVTLMPSERLFEVDENETLLNSAIAAGITLPYGCKDGACGSCKCKLIGGQVSHREHQAKALSPEEKAQGWILTCSAQACSDLIIECKEVSAVDALPIKKIPARIRQLERMCGDVIRITLQMPAHEHFIFHPGQYIDFILKDGVVRSYSIANSPLKQEKILELHVRHMSGGKFTDRVFSTMREKEILRVQGPFGSAYLQEKSDKPIVLVAAGTGFAPIKSIIEYLFEKNDNQRTIHLFWGAKSRQDLYMHDWVVQLQEKMPLLHYTPVLSEALLSDNWEGKEGLVHQAVLDAIPDLRNYQVYACGAPVMVHAAKKNFCSQGMLPIEEFFADAFTSEKDKHKAANNGQNQPQN